VTSLAEAEASREAYSVALDEIEKRALPATVSLKLTQFGSIFQPMRALRTCGIVGTSNRGRHAHRDRHGVDRVHRRTLEIVEKLGSARAVIQAYLYRSEADIARLNSLKIPSACARARTMNRRRWRSQASARGSELFEADESTDG